MNKYLKVFANKKMLVTLLLGFSSGLPLALATSTTIQAWLTQSQINVEDIGYFALIGLPYSLKFIWAPVLDSVKPPFLGLRRGWMVISQVGLFCATMGMAYSDPAGRLDQFALMAFLVAFFSATQDTVIDAYRTEILETEKELGVGASMYVSGYRLAMVVSGGLALVMADHMPWSSVYSAMAALNLIGLVTILFSEEPKVRRSTAKIKVSDVFGRPFLEFFQRNGAMEILLFIMTYKLSTLMATSLMTKFFLSLGYTNTAIGSTNKVFGLIFTIVGTVVGGGLMVKFGLKRSLWIFGVVQSFVGLSFCLLARLAETSMDLKEIWLILIVSLDNFTMGLGTAALTGFMMNFCNKQFTGTQYALLTSVMAVGRVILVAPAGVVVNQIGWDLFFIFTVPLAIPGLLLLLQFDHWQTATQYVEKRLSKGLLFQISLFLGSLFLLSSPPVWIWLGYRDISRLSGLAGAIGIALIVFLGVFKPLLSSVPKRKKSRA